MDKVQALHLAALSVLIVLSGFFSGSESALFSLGVNRVRRLRLKTPGAFQAAQALLKSPTRLISTLLTGNEFVNAAISVLGTSLVYRLFQGSIGEAALSVLSVALVLPFLLILGELVPKSLGLKHPERFVGVTAMPLRAFSRLIHPISWAVSAAADGLLRLIGPGKEGRKRVSEEIFRSMVDAGLKEGVLDEQERRLIHNVFQLDDVRVGQIMTQKQSVSVLHASMSFTEALSQISAERYSRFPVLDSPGGQVCGVLYVKDLVNSAEAARGSTIGVFVRQALTVSPEMNALELFGRFKLQRMHFAVVTDSDSGEMTGVVTLEDVLEEIFGDIRDEHDVEEEPSPRH